MQKEVLRISKITDKDLIDEIRPKLFLYSAHDTQIQLLWNHIKAIHFRDTLGSPKNGTDFASQLQINLHFKPQCLKQMILYREDFLDLEDIMPDQQCFYVNVKANGRPLKFHECQSDMVLKKEQEVKNNLDGVDLSELNTLYQKDYTKDCPFHRFIKQTTFFYSK